MQYSAYLSKILFLDALSAGIRIHWLYILQRDKLHLPPPKNKCPVYDIKLNLVVKVLFSKAQSVEYPFIVMFPRPTTTHCSST